MKISDIVRGQPFAIGFSGPRPNRFGSRLLRFGKSESSLQQAILFVNFVLELFDSWLHVSVIGTRVVRLRGENEIGENFAILTKKARIYADFERWAMRAPPHFAIDRKPRAE